MAKLFLAPDEQKNGNIWLKHVFFKIINNNISEVYTWDMPEWEIGQDQTLIDAYTLLYKTITTHEWDSTSTKVDDALKYMSSVTYSDVKDGKFNGGEKIKFTAAQLAAILADMCAKCKIYWDDLSHTPQELQYFKKTTFGKTLWDYECFLSQDPAAVKTNQQQVNPTATHTRSANTTSGQPQNGYKSSGAQSQNVINLIGQPGVKVYANSSISFCIEADKIGKNTPNAFVKPLDSKAQGPDGNIVYFSSGNFYTDCKCWFDDINNATAFLQKCQTKFGSKYNNIHIAKAKSDQNGYFLVKTEFGDCAIKASRLNEEILEVSNNDELDEDTVIIKRGTKEFDDELKEACDKWNEYLG